MSPNLNRFALARGLRGAASRFWAVLVARNKEFVRDRATLGWNLIFPLVVLVGFSFIFRGEGQNTFQVAILGEAQGAGQEAFLATRHIQFVDEEGAEEAVAKLRRHQFDLVLKLGSEPAYWVNSDAPKGYLVERILWGSVSQVKLDKRTVRGQEIRYVDWLLPGLLAMNMMFSCLIGVGFVIVRYRKSGVLRRLKATPLGAVEFLAAQVVSRLLLVLVVTAVVFVVANALLDFQMEGSYLDLLLIFALGAFSMVCVGLLISARISSEELAGGLLNLLALPMVFLSGVWFSLEGAASWIRTLANVLPLTHVIDAARAVMIDGSGLSGVAGQILTLVAISAICLTVGSLAFRWE